MAIRMKEWGMLATPGQVVDVRTHGLNHWAEAGRALGEGVSDFLNNGVRTVCNAGELARFSTRLKEIGTAVREDLKDGEVKDWNYAWQNAAAPRIAEAVQELSPAVRERGRELAQTYSAQASIEALRDRELQRIADARNQWQQRVDEAVSAGEEEQAAGWLEAGRGVFVPEEQLETRRQELRSRACLSRWQSRLQNSPLQTLSEYAERRGKNSADLPARAEETRSLEQSCERTRHSVRRELARQFSQQLHAGEEPDAATMELATRAGLVQPGPRRRFKGDPPAPTDFTRIAWRRWVDERADGEESELDTSLAIATAALPLAERRALLTRLERSAQVAPADRRAMSNRLYSLYCSGALGCPGDAIAQQFLLALQEEGATLLAEQGAEAASEWLAARRQPGEHWISFEETQPAQRAKA